LSKSVCLIVPSSNKGNNKTKFQANIAYKTVVERKKYTVTSTLIRCIQYNADSRSMAQTYWFHHPFLTKANVIQWGNGKCDKVGEWQMLYSGGMANVIQWGNGKCDTVGEWQI